MSISNEVEKAVCYIDKTKEIDKGTGTQVRHWNPKKKINKNNTSGIRGVCYSEKLSKPWIGSLMIGGKRITRYFETKQEAIDFRHFLEKQLTDPIWEKNLMDLAELESRMNKAKVCPTCGQLIFQPEEAADGQNSDGCNV